MPLQVGSVGSVIRLTVVDQDGAVVDLSGCTLTLNLIIRRKDDSKVFRTPVFETTGADGVLLYTTVAGDLTVSGRYRLQFRHVDAPLNVFTAIAPVNVLENITP